MPSEGENSKDVRGDNADESAARDIPASGAENSENVSGAEADQKIELDESAVKLLGRTQLLMNKTLLCAYSSSGVKFDFTGKHLEVELLGDSAAREDNEENCVRVAIYVNDEHTQDFAFRMA